MRPFGVEFANEGVEAFLLLQAVGARRAGCFLLEGEVHCARGGRSAVDGLA